MKNSYQFKNKVILLFFALTFTTSANAGKATELAKKSQNPISSMISVPLENNANFNSGPGVIKSIGINFLILKKIRHRRKNKIYLHG